MSDILDRLLEAAVYSLLSRPGQFTPSVGDIRAAAVELIHAEQKYPTAADAYAEICEMPADKTDRWVGEDDGETIIYHRMRKFTHLAIAELAEKLGWPSRFPSDNPAANRAQGELFWSLITKSDLRAVKNAPAVREAIDALKADKLPILGAGEQDR